ncbi:MAG: hypothetical protein KIT83_04905 [Bryobacterales bacterium]|nr:hypothetical protein [Bryobacterales bacterium]
MLDQKPCLMLDIPVSWPGLNNLQRYRTWWERRHQRAIAEFERACKARRQDARDRERQEWHEARMAREERRKQRDLRRQQQEQATERRRSFPSRGPHGQGPRRPPLPPGNSDHPARTRVRFAKRTGPIRRHSAVQRDHPPGGCLYPGSVGIYPHFKRRSILDERANQPDPHNMRTATPLHCTAKAVSFGIQAA